MTTEQEKQALSQSLATKYGVAPKIADGEEAYYDDECNYRGMVTKWLWLADDWARLMPLAVDNKVDIAYYTKEANDHDMVGTEITEHGIMKSEIYTNHNDEYEAVRIAICRALLEKE